MSKGGFKKFISPVEVCQHHIRVVYESQTMLFGRCPGNNTSGANFFLRVDIREDQLSQDNLPHKSRDGVHQIFSRRESREPTWNWEKGAEIELFSPVDKCKDRILLPYCRGKESAQVLNFKP